MASTSAPPRTSQVILFSQGRTACHLLERMLSQQPGFRFLWHPWAIGRPSQIPMLDAADDGMPEEVRAPYLEKVREANAAYEKALKEANEAGEALFMHEHPQFAFDPDESLKFVTKEWNTEKETDDFARNRTLIPEKLLLQPGTQVILTLRNPIYTAYAAYKAMSTMERSLTLANYNIGRHIGWIREMYDWYVKNGITPVVAEAEDYMSSQDFVRLLAKKVGMDPDHVIFKWKAATPEEISQMLPMYVKLQQSLIHSEGIMPEKVRKEPLVLEVEVEKWKKEFGEEGARMIKEAVEVSWFHYEYLREKRLKL